MVEHDFIVWLHGFSELNGDTRPTQEQWKMIQEHLSTMFEKVTPELKPAQAVVPHGFTKIEVEDIFKPKISGSIISSDRPGDVILCQSDKRFC